MPDATADAKYGYFHFRLRKEVQNLFHAGFSTLSELCMPSDDKNIDSPSCCHENHPYLATKFRNIMKHPADKI